MEGLTGLRNAFDPRIHQVRGQKGQMLVAANMRKLLAGSEILDNCQSDRVQDAYALRCIPQLHGACRDALEYVREKVEIELNAVTDNPLMFLDDEAVISGGNFHGEPMALPFDFLGIAASEIADASERRTERMVNPALSNGLTAFLTTQAGVNSGFMIGGVQNNPPEIAQYVRCAPLPRITDSDPIYSAEASHIPLVVWKNAKHPEICKAFIEYLYDTDNYVEFIHSVPVGMLPALKDIATNSDYLNDDTIKEYSDCVDVIQTAVDEGHAIGFEHGPSAQASYLTSQGVIEEMFQDIITNGTDVETAAKAAEDKLNDIFDTMIS